MAKLGRLYIPDERDDEFLMQSVPPLMTAKAAKKRKKKVPLRMAWSVPTVLNQLAKPHCVAFAWKHYLMAAPISQGEFLNEAFLYELAQKYDCWPGENYDGTSVRAGAKVLRNMGFVESYRWGKSAADVKKWVMTRGPVVLGTRWYVNMSRLKNGYARPTGRQMGGHAYLCFAYWANRNAFRCLNSWGPKWGNNGRFWITYNHLDKLIKQQGEACVAIERDA